MFPTASFTNPVAPAATRTLCVCVCVIYIYRHATQSRHILLKKSYNLFEEVYKTSSCHGDYLRLHDQPPHYQIERLQVGMFHLVVGRLVILQMLHGEVDHPADVALGGFYQENIFCWEVSTNRTSAG